MWYSGKDYSANHGQMVGRQGPSPANRLIPDAADLNVYRSARWLGLLNETDGYRRSGALELVEQQYLDLLGKLKQVQGANSVDVGWMLDRIGEFYLDTHEFDKAYQSFAAALAVRQNNIQAINSNAQAATNPQLAALLVTCRAHVVKLLVALGRLDAAKGDVAHASQELSDAVGMGNQLVRLRDGLDAVYFQSQLLEHQGKWQDAEALWQGALKVREKMTLSAAYWDLMVEQAAFYARRGDYHSAAELVKRVQTETMGKRLKPILPIPDSLESRQGGGEEDGLWAGLYKAESDKAMAEILALDRWQTDGPEAAAPLFAAQNLKDSSLQENMLFGRGSSARRARWYAFLTQRAFLHMSVLLDGSPSPELVESAYQTLQPVKGRYMDSLAELMRVAESDRDNPHVSHAEFSDPTIMLDELARDRANRAHVFVAAALDGGHFSNVEFAAREQAEQNALEGIAFQKQYQVDNNTHAGDPSGVLPADAAFIDFTAWQRTDRKDPTKIHREYGAFVMRKGKPMRFIPLGAAVDIDADVAALESLIVGPHVRGAHLIGNPQEKPATVDDIGKRLKSLYQEVIAPMQGAIGGAKKLLIVPDGQLTLAPFAAFSDAHGRYLLQDYTVSYLGSWRDLYLASGQSANKTRPSVIVANPDFNLVLAKSQTPAVSGRLEFEPLPNTELEAQDVEQVLKVSSDRVLIGKHAREEAIRSLSGPQILHFATHSVPNLEWKIPTATYDLFEYPRSFAMDDPLLESVIVLAGGNNAQRGPEDGLLTGLEVASLRLSGTRLVVLSTCEAGLGTPVDGQGVLGLRAAFSIAGAEGLVMTLWPVDDRAGRLFMQYFYAHLDAGAAEAIRKAQLDMVAKSEFKQPQYWAGYAYSGIASSDDLRKSSAAPAQAADTLVDPNCLEVTSHRSSGRDNQITTYRLRIATVRKSSSSSDRVTYDLIPPASDLERSSATILSNGQVFKDPDIRVASHAKFAVSLTVERTNKKSAVSIREYVPAGDPRYKPSTLEEIRLVGGPQLFPSLDFPASFPPLSAYAEAYVAGDEDKRSDEKIDKVGACSAQAPQ